MTGIVKGYEVTTNRNSSQKVLILQVEISGPDDVQSVEWYSGQGQQSIPLIESKVQILQNGSGWKVAVSSNDGIDFDESLKEGEKKIYNKNQSGTITMKADGTIEINGNADFAVSHTDLNIALQALVTKINANFALKLDGGGTAGTSTLDLSGAKVEKVKFP